MTKKIGPQVFLILRIFILIVLSTFLITGCGSQFEEDIVGTSGNQQGSNGGTDGNGSGGGDGTGGGIQGQIDIREVDARVVLPAASGLSLQGLTLMTQLEQYPVSADGSVTALQNSEGRVLAILLDGDGNALLTGFITDDKREISVASTVEVLLFFGLDTASLPEEIRANFWNQVSEFDRFDEIVAEAEALFISDSDFLSSQALQDLIRPYILELALELNTIDIRPRLNFDPVTKSGLSLNDSEGDFVTVVNRSRRRCRAFVYKVTQTDLNDDKTILIDSFENENPSALASAKVSPTAAVVGIVGIPQTAASGKGLDFARVESDPLPVELDASENEVEYKVRVIGPSVIPGSLTSQEKVALRRLSIETLALDYILPLLVGAATDDSFLDDVKKTDAAAEPFISLVEQIVNSVEPMNDAVEKADFAGARAAFSEAFIDGILGETAELVAKEGYNLILQQAAKGTEANAARLAQRANNLGLALAALEKVLEAVDTGRRLLSSFQNPQLEEFCVTNTRNDVQIVPALTVAIQGESRDLSAIVQDGQLSPGQVYEYEWSTTGTYGEIQDSVGNSGTSFTSSQSTISYISSGVVSLPSEAEDKVFVKVFVRDGLVTTELNDAEATVRVLESGFQITPQDITLNGCQSLILRTTRTDGSNPVDDTSIEYRFDWDTSGRFGSFSKSKFESRFNENSVRYTALEKDDDGTEEISCSIYSRAKGTNDPFKFLDRINTTIEIDNDPNTRIFYVTGFVFSGPFIQNGMPVPGSTYIDYRFVFEEQPDALRYTAELVEFTFDGLPVPPVGTSVVFQANQPNDGNRYRRSPAVVVAGDAIAPPIIQRYGRYSGLMKVTVELDPNR